MMYCEVAKNIFKYIKMFILSPRALTHTLIRSFILAQNALKLKKSNMKFISCFFSAAIQADGDFHWPN